MRNAALGFVGTSGLGGTPSSVALYKFSTTATKFLDLTSITANQTAVKDRAAKALIDLVIVGNARTSIERDVQGSD